MGSVSKNDDAKENENDSTVAEEAGLKGASRPLCTSTPEVEAVAMLIEADGAHVKRRTSKRSTTPCRRPLESVNVERSPRPSPRFATTPPPKVRASSIRSEPGTPAPARKALDAVLEAVCDVLLMEAQILAENQTPQRDEPAPSDDSSPSDDESLPLVWQTVVSVLAVPEPLPIVKPPAQEGAAASWLVCGGNCMPNPLADTVPTCPAEPTANTILLDLDADQD